MDWMLAVYDVAITAASGPPAISFILATLIKNWPRFKASPLAMQFEALHAKPVDILRSQMRMLIVE